MWANLCIGNEVYRREGAYKEAGEHTDKLKLSKSWVFAVAREQTNSEDNMKNISLSMLKNNKEYNSFWISFEDVKSKLYYLKSISSNLISIQLLDYIIIKTFYINIIFGNNKY